MAMNGVVIGSVSSSAAALRGFLRGGLPMAGVCGLHERHADSVSDFCDLRPLAAQAGVPFVAFDKVTEPVMVEFLAGVCPDWLFVIGLSQLVPVHLRQLASAGAVGFHPTPLPEGRGRAPVAWTILLQKQAAANLFFLTDEADAGDLIAQRPVAVMEDDYAQDLIDRTNRVLEALATEMAPQFAAGAVPRFPQDPARATHYPRRRPEDGRIDWQRPAEEVHRLIRAVSRPYPGAFTLRFGCPLTIWRAELLDRTAADAVAGQVVEVRKRQPVIQAQSGRLLLTDTEMKGESFPAWTPGERLI